MSKSKFIWISDFYWSNCLIEAIKAKIRNPHIKVYIAKPDIKNHRMFHFIWSDGKHSYDFSDKDEFLENSKLPWFLQVIVFKGGIRQFEDAEFAKRYTSIRNHKIKK